MLPVVIVMICLAVLVQLWLCFGEKRNWVKLIPLCLIGLGELACGVCYLMFDHIYGAAFVALIYGIVLLFMLAGDGVAWLIYFLVKKAQKTK